MIGPAGFMAAPKQQAPREKRGQCAWWIEPGNGLTSVTPGYQCTRNAGYGPGRNYCAQHAKKHKPANDQI